MWMAIIVVAPEFGVAMAVDEYLKAKPILQETQNQWPEERLSLAHAFYANMEDLRER
jgi:hypothetical protein